MEENGSNLGEKNTLLALLSVKMNKKTFSNLTTWLEHMLRR